MTKSIKVTPKKKPGRPATGRAPRAAARMPATLISEVEAWAVANDTSRSEAIRRLVELGLTLKTRSVPSERQRAALAAKAIDSLTGGAPDNDEKASRKRRLGLPSQQLNRIWLVDPVMI